MNKSVSTVQNNNVERFADSRLGKVNQRAFWLPAQNNEVRDNFYVSDIKQIFITPEQARKTNNTKLIGLSIAGATVFTAIGIFMLLGGGPKGMAKGFGKIKKYLEGKILSSKMNTGATPNKVMLYLLNMTEDALGRAEMINNFTSFKDVLFKKIMSATRFTESTHEKITKVFTKIGKRTVEKSYNSTIEKIKDADVQSAAYEYTTRELNPAQIIEINGVKMSKSQWMEKIRQYNTDILKHYSDNFGQSALNNRQLRMKKAVKDLYENFRSMKIFASVDTLKTFIAESFLVAEKSDIQKSLKSHRNFISHNLSDVLADSNNKIMDIVKILGYKDSDNISKIASVRGDIKKYLSGSAQDVQLKQEILEKISTLKKDIEIFMDNTPLKQKDGEALIKNIDELSDIISNYTPGKVEEILQIYRKILPDERYAIVESAYKKAVKSLDDSIKIESEDYMSKLRDLALGSAPTDVLTILGSVGVLGYHLGRSKDSDQRQSIALKYGFPALAGIGVSLYCNAKLFAGSKSLIVGSLSTFILNRIGEWGDKKLKEYKSKSK